MKSAIQLFNPFPRKKWKGPQDHLRCNASSSDGERPACACPINRKTTPNPDGVRRPRFSLSAICHICKSPTWTRVSHPTPLAIVCPRDQCPIATYQTKCIRRQFRLLEKRDGDLAGDDAEIGGVGCLEKLVKDALFLWREIEVRMALCCNEKDIRLLVPLSCA